MTETDWVGDDQQWWDWYITLADNPDAVGELVAGPPVADVPAATEEQAARELAEPYPLTDAMREAFRRDAFVKLPAVLSPAVVKLLDQRLETLLAAEHGRETAGRFLALEQMWLEDPLMRAVALSTRLGDLAAQLMGVDGVRLYHDNALSKESGCGRTPWHHDAAHFPFDPPSAVTAWIPVTGIPAAMGPLSFARGADLQERLFADISIDQTDPSYDGTISRGLRDAGVEVEDGPFEVGDVSFHGAQAFHTAGANRTTVPRRALATTYLADGVRVRTDLSILSGTWREFIPDAAPGERIAGRLNPLVGRDLRR